MCNLPLFCCIRSKNWLILFSGILGILITSQLSCHLSKSSPSNFLSSSVASVTETYKIYTCITSHIFWTFLKFYYISAKKSSIIFIETNWNHQMCYVLMQQNFATYCHFITWFVFILRKGQKSITFVHVTLSPGSTIQVINFDDK